MTVKPADRQSESLARPIGQTEPAAAFPAVDLAVIVLLYCGLSWISFGFVGDDVTGVPIWPLSALLLGVLLQSRPASWPFHAAVALLIGSAAGFLLFRSWDIPLGLTAATVAETVIAALALRRMFPGDFRLGDVRRMAALFGVGSLSAACVGATISAATLHAVHGQPFWQTWFDWWLAVTTGIVAVSPLLLTWRDFRALGFAAPRQRVEALVAVLVTTALTAAILSRAAEPLLFIVIPLAVWAAFRLGVALTAAVCAMVALTAILMIWIGGGSIAALTDSPRELTPRILQGFLAAMSLSSLMVAMAWERSRAAERELRLNEMRFRDFAESASDRFWETDEDDRFTWLSRPGGSPRENDWALIGRSRAELADAAPPPDEHWRKHQDDIAARRPFRDFSYGMRTADGRYRFHRVSGRPMFDESGNFKGYRGTTSVITQTMESEMLAAQLGRIVEEALNEIYVVDARSLRFLLVNRGARDNLGYSMNELRMMTPADICVDMSADELRAKFRELELDHHTKLTVELSHRRKDGTIYAVETHLQRVAVGSMPAVYVALVLDISRRKQVLAELAAKSRLLEATLDSMAQGICVYDRDLRLVAFNRNYVDLLDYPEGFIQLGGKLEDHLRDCAVRGLFGPGDPEEMIAERIEIARDGLQARRIYRRADGLVLGSNRQPMPDGGFVTTFSDITQRYNAEEALQQSTVELQDMKASFEAAIKASRQILYDWNTIEDSVRWDGETDLILGYTAQELEGLPDWMELIHPEDRRMFVRQRAQAVMAQDVFSLEYRVCRKDGRYIPVADRGVFLAGTRGGAKRIVGFISDISAQKATEEALRQSDKLLAVGQLTGGIAHDFNNLLAIILGNIELLSEDLGDDPAHQHHIQTALTAAHRGAALTQRLLAFARKQPLQPRSTQLNHVVSEMSELLRRSLDPSISLEMILASDLWTTRIDPSGLENALLNLALNARDAMPKGGQLTLETGNVRLDAEYAARHQEVRPGEYVMLSVTDSGVGMPPDVRDRAFEPFFTTKPVGQGSGLGLPMVYGFVKQSQGHAQIESEEGIGTTVRLYLPRDESEASQEPEPEPESAHGVGGGERVLVVEDNEDVRSLTNLVLNGLGYRTVLAGDARSALDILAANQDIDVLFTDIVLPGGTNGFELAQQACVLRPRLKVLYTSGYTNNAIIQSGAADDTIVLIAKPYRKADLAQKMRQVLAKESANGE